jgi:hypothetical protein
MSAPGFAGVLALAILAASCSSRVTIEHGTEPITIGIGEHRDRDDERRRRPPPVIRHQSLK